MRRPSLTDRAQWVSGRLAHEYEVGGGSVLAHDSALNCLLVIEMLNDPALDEGEKAELLVRMVLAEPDAVPPEDALSVLDSVLWDMAGIDLTGTRDVSDGGKRAFDWGEDAMRIKASLLMAYGLDWDEACRKYTFAEVCDLLSMLLETDEKTPFAEAVYYRTAKPPRPDQHNADYVRAWRSNQRRYRLRGGEAAEEERRRDDAAAAAAFDALWKAAQG